MGKYATHYTDEELQTIKEQWLKDKKQVDEDYEGRIVKIPSESKEVLELSDEDPGLLKWMDEKQEEWRRKHPNLTREEMDRRIDEILESEKELRKKSPY